MPSLLQQLENNEAVLLMYLANELPFEDREEVEQMLSVDANLRAELAHLREADAAFSNAMFEADEATPLPVPQPVAARRASRAIRQWVVNRAVQEAPVAHVHRELRFAWWAYPLATAAMLLLAWLAWWGNHADGDHGAKIGPDSNELMAHNDDNSDSTSEEIINDGGEADHVQYAISIVGVHGLEERPDDSLSSAEKQLRSLSALGATATEPLYLPRLNPGFNQ